MIHLFCRYPYAYMGVLKEDQLAFVMEILTPMRSLVNTPSAPIPSGPKAEYQTGMFSDNPSNVFESDNNSVYSHFGDS